MDPQTLVNSIREKKLAVVSTLSTAGQPQSALVGIAVMPRIEVVFDTSRASRKACNLCRHPHASLVIGWEHETTLQCEGWADEPSGTELERCKAAYFAAFPEGVERGRSPGITYFRVTPRWMHYSNFGTTPPTIVEMMFTGQEFVVTHDSRR